MNDAEYLFKQISAERKRNGYGDYHKKRQGGRQVRLPSDHYTKKELAAMSSEVTSYNLSAPTQWHEFITWPKDLQVEYIQRLEEAYNAKNEDIAGMLDVSKSCYRKYKNSLGLKSKAGHGKPLDQDGWAKFIGANEFDPEIIIEKKSESSPVVEEKVELPEKKEEKQEPVKIDHSSIMNIAILLDALKGSGAKLTIEVVL